LMELPARFPTPLFGGQPGFATLFAPSLGSLM
jgi:hypothetical protein